MVWWSVRVIEFLHKHCTAARYDLDPYVRHEGVHLSCVSALLFPTALLWHTKQIISLSHLFTIMACVRSSAPKYNSTSLQLRMRNYVSSSSVIFSYYSINRDLTSSVFRPTERVGFCLVLFFSFFRLHPLPLQLICFPMNTGTWNAGTVPFPVAVICVCIPEWPSFLFHLTNIVSIEKLSLSSYFLQTWRFHFLLSHERQATFVRTSVDM